jgi:hypothetical protein
MLQTAALVCALMAVPACQLFPSPKTFELGEQGSDGKVAVRVGSVKLLAGLTQDNGSPVPNPPGTLWVLADVAVKNQTEDSIVLDPDGFSLLDSGRKQVGQRYGWDAAGSEPEVIDLLSHRDLGPGRDVRGQLLFAAKKGAKLSGLLFDANPDILFDLKGLPVRAQVRPPARVGQVALARGVQMVVHSVRYAMSVGGEGATTRAKSGHRLVIVDLSVRNVSLQPGLEAECADIVLVDSAGERWRNTGTDGLAYGEALQDIALHPGGRTRGRLLYMLDNGRRPTMVRFPMAVLGPPLQVAIK